VQENKAELKGSSSPSRAISLFHKAPDMAFEKLVRTFWSAHLRHIKIDGEVGIPQCHPSAASRPRPGTIPGHATRAACSVAQASSVRWMVEARCINKSAEGCMGGGSPLRYPAGGGPGEACV
jgi:hypothetical protein